MAWMAWMDVNIDTVAIDIVNIVVDVAIIVVVDVTIDIVAID